MIKTISDNEIKNLVTGECNDPFSYFGKHKLNKDIFVIRTFHPTAKQIFLITKQNVELLEFIKIHPDGLFEIQIKNDLKEYKFLIIYNDDSQKIENDTYNFLSTIGDMDEYLFCEGKHYELFNKLGAHLITLNGIEGISFAVWAPNAFRVSVVGDFNNWDGRVNIMRKHHSSGIWDIFIPDIKEGVLYKFEILDKDKKLLPLKTDPFGFFHEFRPKTASIVYDITKFKWVDNLKWSEKRKEINSTCKPISIYEVHLGSWKKKDFYNWMNYRELADNIVPYVNEMGFTHIELLPIMEHPFDGSWGYQTTGMFAPTSRYGTPDDFKYFIEKCHNAGIGVILDWVAAHFPKDLHGLINFDGTNLYEYADDRKGEHKDWGSKIYDYSKKEVVSFLISSAVFWCEIYKIDGLRFDAVASMLYLDYSRKDGEWLPNKYGGKENLEAIDFIKQINSVLYEKFPYIATFAEESTSWPGVSKPVYNGGLGFGYKWNMGWMHDSLEYISKNPIYRKYHHYNIPFCVSYAFSENFVLPISHDEVVHGKKSLLTKMDGDEWQQFANLRAFYSLMWTLPGKKLLFMGQEIAEPYEWNKDTSLNWNLLFNVNNKAIQTIVKDLNYLYKNEKSLCENESNQSSFSWISADDKENCVFSFIRYAKNPKDYLIVVANMTPIVRYNYRIGVGESIFLTEIFNSDDLKYNGSNVKNNSINKTEKIPFHNKEFSVCLTLPPLAVVILKPNN